MNVKNTIIVEIIISTILSYFILLLIVISAIFLFSKIKKYSLKIYSVVINPMTTKNVETRFEELRELARSDFILNPQKPIPDSDIAPMRNAIVGIKSFLRKPPINKIFFVFVVFIAMPELKNNSDFTKA